jgi:hypothetical protein
MAVATITVGSVNDAPTTHDGSTKLAEDSSAVITLAGTDSDTGDAVDHYVIDSLPSHGSLLLNGNAVHAGDSVTQADIDAGHLTFTPEANWSGDTSIAFHAHDGDALSANAGSFAIHVDTEVMFSDDDNQPLEQVTDLPLALLHDVVWTDAVLDDLLRDSPDLGFGDPWHALDRADELVGLGLGLGLDASGQPILGIPVLRDVFQLEVGDHERSIEPVLWAPSELVSVMERHPGREATPVETRWPVYPAETDAISTDSATPDGTKVQVSPGGIAAIWGLLRGFAGMRFRDRGDDM